MRRRLLPLLLVPLALLPDLAAAVPWRSYYFRDFTLTFYPLRLFQARELSAGRWPFWNPYTHQGSFLLPAVYPTELLHALWPGPAAVSWLLTLHLPLAALGAYWLARQLGTSRAGAFLSGGVYALGGLALSSLNLYVFLQALALAPWLAGALRLAGVRGGRAIVLAALALAASLATLAVEFVSQAVILGAALGLLESPRPPTLRRLALAIGLGTGLAALPVMVTLGMLSGSVRASGFAFAAASHAVPPISLLQALVPGLFGSLTDPLQAWWGGHVFTEGFPYFFSLYLGPLTLGLVAAGALHGERKLRWLLLALGGVGLWYALGEAGGLASWLSSFPLVRWFRFPSKALLLPYCAVALLAGRGLQRLSRGEGWRGLGWACGASAVLALGMIAGVLGTPESIDRWLALDTGTGSLMRSSVVPDCGRAAALAASGVGLALLVRGRRIRPALGAWLVGAVAVLDLVRAGAGVNPQVPAAFFRPIPEIAALGLDRLEGGRVFSCPVTDSPAMRDFLAGRRPGTGLWAFFVDRQMLDPYNNLLDRVETAESSDRTSFLTAPPLVGRGACLPGALERTLPLLRSASVSRVLSLDPIDHPDLHLLATAQAGPSGLVIRAYELVRPWPRAYLACRVILARSATEAVAQAVAEGFDAGRDVVLAAPGEATCRSGRVERLGGVAGLEHYRVEGDGAGYLVTRDSFARGWAAAVDGTPVPVLLANGRQRAVPIPAGRHDVILRFRPRGLDPGLGVSLASALAVLALAFRPVLVEPPPV